MKLTQGIAYEPLVTSTTTEPSRSEDATRQVSQMDFATSHGRDPHLKKQHRVSFDIGTGNPPLLHRAGSLGRNF
jgi:hypothetical protein